MHPLPPDWQNTFNDYNAAVTRRQFFRKTGTGLGVAALASLLGERAFAANAASASAAATLNTAMTEPWKIAPKAKRAIYISLIGAPSQLDLFDYKPALQGRFKEDLKDWLAGQGERLTGMTAKQAAFPLAPTIFKFAQYGQGGMWISELLPNIAKMADDVCFIRSMKTDAINHEPANQLVYTGSMQNGKASMGSWLSYGLGTLNKDLPAFVVLHAKHTSPFSNVQAISSRLWGSGFLEGRHAGVSFRTQGDPVLYLNDAPASRGSCAARCSTASANSTAAATNRLAIRKSRHARSNTSWRSACRPACPSSRTSPANPPRPTNSTAKRRARVARLPAPPSWPAASSSAACGSCRFSTAAGTNTAACRATSLRSAKTWTAPATASCRI
jgi:hypothetical protein